MSPDTRPLPPMFARAVCYGFLCRYCRWQRRTTVKLRLPDAIEVCPRCDR